MLLPHISQAVELLTEKARQRQARLDLARGTYVRTLVLDASPINPQALANAVETLGLTTADLLEDAQSAQLHRDSLTAIPNLQRQIQDHLNTFPPPGDSDPDCDDYVPAPELLELQNQFELAQRHVLDGPRRSPRLFSLEAQKLLQPPIDTIPSPTITAEPMSPVQTPDPEPSIIESTNTEPTSKTPAIINEPYAW